jgi:hypothetical protein
MSSIEIEYTVASHVTKQVMWIPSLFGSIGIPQMKPIIIYDKVVYLYKRTSSFMLA